MVTQTSIAIEVRVHVQCVASLCDVGKGLTEYNEDEVEPPMDLPERNRRDLVPDGADDPVAQRGRNGVSTASNLHRHDFCHVNPRSVVRVNILVYTSDREKREHTRRMIRTRKRR
jgi:hypothetical protein